MLLLSTGRIIDLSTDRAKYHALKQHGPLPGAAHRDLYSLIDIIYRHRNAQGDPRLGWTEYDYDFSAYTLADIHLATDWSETEKIELYRWVKGDAQKQQIETARRRLVENQQKLSVKHFSAPHSLYSSLYVRLDTLSLQQANTKQWLATINNMQQSGIRQEEVIWSGLATFLAKQPPDKVINKAQILERIVFKNIRLELSIEQIWGTDGGLRFREVAYKLPHQIEYRATLELDDSCFCILRYVDDTCNYQVGVVKTLASGHSMALNKYWFALDPYGRTIENTETHTLFYQDSNAAMSAADRHARDQFGLQCGAKFHTRFDHLTLFGGYDYREWLISLPDHQRIFFGAHHFDHNVLVHLRTTTRQDQQDRKLLFIEEVQSDWHQKGQANGYDTSPWGKVADAPFKKEWPVLAIKLMLIYASQNAYFISESLHWQIANNGLPIFGETVIKYKASYAT